MRCGKTALLTQVSNNLLSSQLPFDFVIWVVASQDPNSERIQGDIGKEIGFLEDRWKGKSFQEKAREVSSVLSQKKFVLLVDDLWKPVELAEVGVPSRENGSKLEKVGEDTLNIHPEIPELAETSARMCNGLPLALITGGRAMAFKKTLSEWHHSIKALSRATEEFFTHSLSGLVLLKFRLRLSSK
ncbi:hypothetical protein NC651_029558 [Populus alba x Populus x berolinensis]|nr:hypothetical protein NC651_029558 [Populus alba x Populus x berolinensis]